MEVKFLSPLIAEELPEDVWRLYQPLLTTVSGVALDIPKGFLTDFCSVPRIPIVYDQLGNRWRKAGVLHDWLYQFGELPKETADNILYHALIELGANALEARIVWRAVDLFGGKYFRPKPKLAPMPQKLTTPEDSNVSGVFPYVS